MLIVRRFHPFLLHQRDAELLFGSVFDAIEL